MSAAEGSRDRLVNASVSLKPRLINKKNVLMRSHMLLPDLSVPLPLLARIAGSELTWGEA